MAGILTANTINVNRVNSSSGTNGLDITHDGDVNIDRKLHISGLDHTPFAYVYFTHNASYVSHTASVPIEFDVAEENDGNHYSTTTYKFTCPVDGLYRMEISMLTQLSTDQFSISFHKNDVFISRTYFVHRSGLAAKTIKCTAGQTLHFEMDNTKAIYRGSDEEGPRYVWATYMLVG